MIPRGLREKVSDIAAMMDSTHADCDPKGVHSGEDGDLPCFNVIVPTLNAAPSWNDFASALLQCVTPAQVLILDSASTDGTPELARAAGFRVHNVPRAEFNHGGTRQLGATLSPEPEILVYMTQDAILTDLYSLSALLSPFRDPKIAATFGRQLPRPQAGPLEAHARLFNYPDQSSIRSFESRSVLGFKTIFISNSFAAYRRSALMSVGGFPTNVIFGEDTVTMGRLLLNGWKAAYVAEASVYHSHAYNYAQELRRYFDIGVLHSREQWLLEEYGGAGGEGKRFIRSELEYLWPRFGWLIPSAMLRSGLKLLGYRLGRLHDRFPNVLRRRFSMNSHFWELD